MLHRDLTAQFATIVFKHFHSRWPRSICFSGLFLFGWRADVRPAYDCERLIWISTAILAVALLRDLNYCIDMSSCDHLSGCLNVSLLLHLGLFGWMTSSWHIRRCLFYVFWSPNRSNRFSLVTSVAPKFVYRVGFIRLRDRLSPS